MPEHAPDIDVDFAALVAAFGYALHDAGLAVTPDRSTRFAQAVLLARPRSVTDLYWVARISLVTDHEQLPVFDRVFRQVFRGLVNVAEIPSQVRGPGGSDSTPSGDRPSDSGAEVPMSASTPRATSATPGHGDGAGDDGTPPSVLAAMSTDERLTTRDFAACTPEELALLRELVEQLPLVPPMRRTRRTVRAAHGPRLDVHATLRRAHRTGGDPVDLVLRTRVERPRRIVLLADVSGSMEPYSRVYLHLLRGAVRTLGAEAFAFATRLTRLTRALSDEDHDAAYRRARQAAADWSGGTRIGRTLMEFLDTHGRRGMARGAIVVIVSDGWEVDDPAVLGEAMARLARLAHRVIWVNPRSAAPGYAPLVAGMAAALPHVDTFVSGHSVRALADVMAAISGDARRGVAA